MLNVKYQQANAFVKKYKVASLLEGNIPAYYSGVGAQAKFLYGEENANLYDTREEAETIIVSLKLPNCYVVAPPPPIIYNEAPPPPPEDL